MGEIGPLACERALRAFERSARFPGEKIREIEEKASAAPCIGQMPLQPHELGSLHFRRHDAADVVQDGVLRCGAFLGLGQRTVIEPDDGIPTILAGRRNAQRGSILIACDEGTRRIETNASHTSRSNTSITKRPANSDANRRPDVLGIVFRMVGSRPLHRDGMFSAAEKFAAAIKDACAGASGSDVNRDDMIGH